MNKITITSDIDDRMTTWEWPSNQGNAGSHANVTSINTLFDVLGIKPEHRQKFEIIIQPIKGNTGDCTNRPMAAPGLTSYRCKNRFGWTMIGAKNNDDAFREALRSDPNARRDALEVWDGKQYVKVKP